MTNKRIILNEKDYKSLTLLIDKLKSTQRFKNMYMKVLGEEMESAQIGDINNLDLKNVTLNSKVKYKDLKSGRILKASIVFPAFADSTKDLYSILTPLGAALIGEEVGNITTCYAPSGELELKILEIEPPVPGGE